MIGPSGCGKSTFLRIVAGLDTPTAGEILVSGRKVTGPGADRGMVFQEYALLPWKTTAANIEFGPRLKRHAARTSASAIARRFVDLVGLKGFENKYPHQLSGGMRQRAAVARVLANNPAVLLMDEPFAAVDAMTRQRLQEELTAITRVERTTVLFVTHAIEEAVFLSDRVVALSGRPGRIVADLAIELPRPRALGRLSCATPASPPIATSSRNASMARRPRRTHEPADPPRRAPVPRARCLRFVADCCRSWPASPSGSAVIAERLAARAVPLAARGCSAFVERPRLRRAARQSRGQPEEPGVWVSWSAAPSPFRSAT